ncbi:UNVERIFIED_CONTAM: hypothetical protein GTU68_037017 [Idotea baltica]|nr:hypothetical protein [Idotea baltica]
MNPIYFSTQFTCSAEQLSQCPDSVAEVAFAGRSNAGKSSAINAITRNGKLARTSKTPGRTQLINHFAVHEQRYIVDLPGYGYAQVSKAKQKAWRASMLRYLTRRESLRGLVVVMDIRHPLRDSDWAMIEIQQESNADLHLLLTKADKISRSAQQQAVMRVQKEVAEAGISATIQDFSALKGTGLDDAHRVLDAWLFDREL